MLSELKMFRIFLHKINNFSVKFDIFTAATRRIPFSGMLRHVASVTTELSEERMAFNISVTRIC
jgi:hypothetical protein